MRVLVTGAQGFVGRNLIARLEDIGLHDVLTFTRQDSDVVLSEKVAQTDFIFHLAGENRPATQDAFETVNFGLTDRLCDLVENTGRKIPIVFSSTTQAAGDSAYGLSKRRAEERLQAFSKAQDIPVMTPRLPNVFGKWCRPNYNSVVATFCHNIARGLPIKVNDPSTELELVYIDDLVDWFMSCLDASEVAFEQREMYVTYKVTLDALQQALHQFHSQREQLHIENVGTGFYRALYATYLSYLPLESFSYQIPVYGDDRGAFAEVLKTPDCGQFSFFTMGVGIVRGGHYHHTKAEKFLVLQGSALFGFRNLLDGRIHEIAVTGAVPTIVETVPGWVHDIRNTGDTDVVAMLWANEVFDHERPDTIIKPMREDVDA